MARAMIAWLLAAGLAAPAAAQLALPRLDGVVGGTVDGVGRAASGLVRPVGEVAGGLERLASARIDRLAALIRDNPASIEPDDRGEPARAHEVLLLDADEAALAAARQMGFRQIAREAVAGLDVPYARLETPAGMPLARALRTLRRRLPGVTVTADPLHLPAGTAIRAEAGGNVPAAVRGGTVGVIDSGALASVRIAAQEGFATGAPRPGAHGQAIASLLAGAGTARVYVADVYGRDPAGGGALAIARALGWMAANRVPVVSISLVGPANPLLARAVAAARAKGILVVAAVGNDGAAAPPAYPASYPGVIAVTGVDARLRPLFEAGRALHLDYAAPGADLAALGLDGRPHALRGTSFAAPLAAARLAAHGPGASERIARADAEAIARSPRTGRGVLCATCRNGT